MASVGSPPNALRSRDATRGAAGRYGFVAEIARGYLGTLWVARDPSDHTATAFVRHVTPISSESARASLLEAARGAIVAGAETLEVHEAKTGVDIVSPFEDGEVLRTLLRTAALRHTPPPAEVLLGIASEIAMQLHHQHTDGNGSLPVFGGLHADSLFIGTDGTVRLLDAGAGVVASALEPWRSDPQRVGYFAPEQIEAKGTLDARTDVFSLGILLWEAFANRRLFPGNDARSARERVLRAPIPRLDATQKSATSGVSTPIADLVSQALSRDAASRFASMEAMSRALASLDRASAEVIGEWVLGLAGPVIEKRRALLERTGTAHSAAQVASALVQTTPAPVAPVAVAPLAAALPPAAPPPELPPLPSPVPVPVAEAPAGAAPQLPSTPKPPPVAAVTPIAPVVARPLATPRAPEAVTEPAPSSAEPSAPPLAEAAATEPESAGPQSTEPVVMASEGVAGKAPEASPPAESVPPEADDAEPSSETRGRDSGEAIDVGAEDLAASDAPPARKSGPPPPPSLKRPPRLPDIAAATGAHAEEDVLGGDSPSLASPIAVSQLGALTQKPPESRATWIIGAVAALLLGIGGIFLLKGGGGQGVPNGSRPASGADHAEAPANVVPRPAEPAAAEIPKEPAAPAPPAPVAVPPVEVEASEPKAAPPSEPKAEALAPEKAPSPPPAEKPRAAPREGSPPAKPRSTPETGQHRPPPSRSAPGSTYKPGGI